MPNLFEAAPPEAAEPIRVSQTDWPVWPGPLHPRVPGHPIYPGFDAESALDVARRLAIVLAIFGAFTGACAWGSRPAKPLPADREIAASVSPMAKARAASAIADADRRPG